ncbi:DinB family protein [Rhodococcus chondri]|uniref:DinB family protein n=1 Tax=Rhodococcus chondri TaxID=3065941 RepID=A0ABU7JPM9_9NOCA|nr:DinB family protein [Rhodococcus sp. CC-R104]MEE2031991.1 DinB family protein [Rhodococcus sp. CC-R104]
MSERDRFLSLFDQIVEQTIAFAELVDDASYTAVPIDTPELFLGTRVDKITIGGLLRHLILAEAHWFEQVRQASPGAAIPFPGNAAALEEIPDGVPLLERYRRDYTNGRAQLRTLTEEDLAKEVSFAGRRYTVMGFLWTVLGHHSFHLGQIDLLMRQQGIEPPEYMEWPENRLIIG